MRTGEDPEQWHGTHIVNGEDLSFSSDDHVKKSARRRHNAFFLGLAALVLAVTVGALLITTGKWTPGVKPSAVADPIQTPASIKNAKCPEVDFTYQDPTSFRIRVLNTTDITGLAGNTAKSLEDRGFKISSLTSGWESLSGTVGAVIAGPDGYAQAFTVQRQVPGTVFIFDEKKYGSNVDLALGEKFESLQKDRKLDTSAGKLVCE
ncbi:LytR C-terminal domain-containing protein [Glutamicibacter sp. JC586]|uniref:LytR C-terminal domain-containing protein n=1 Tax=Glutamicibacter sp. JC586 TaxID=2590552 RepID=UPI0013595029|nr:LytR C-terminal domain-containing protein [Glutamicibacter sp. JC586]